MDEQLIVFEMITIKPLKITITIFKRKFLVGCGNDLELRLVGKKRGIYICMHEDGKSTDDDETLS